MHIYVPFFFYPGYVEVEALRLSSEKEFGMQMDDGRRNFFNKTQTTENPAKAGTKWQKPTGTQ